MDASPNERARPVPVRPMSSHERLVRLVSKPRAALAIAALAVLMSLPALTVGLAGDDFDLALAVTRDPLSGYAFLPRDPVERNALVLSARDAGSAPWWSDPDRHIAFFRPLASLSLALDFALWPSAPWLMHLENSLLFAAIVLLAAALYRAFGLPVRACGLATFFFAMHGAQSMTTGWISGRNTLLATLFGFGSLRLFIAAQRGRRGLLFAAFAAFAAALLSAEGGVATLAYLFAYAHCFGRAPVPTSDSKSIVTPVQRWAGLWGFALLLLAWLTAYKLGGYGVKGSGFYVDPVENPLRFSLDLLAAIPIYLASQLTIPFAGTTGVHPLALPVVAAISLLLLCAFRSLWLPWLRLDSRARALGLGAVLAIVPLGTSIPQDRLVSFIALGVCGIVALSVDERLSPAASGLPQRGARRLFRYHAFWAPLLYVPFLFGSLVMIAGGGGILLDRVLGNDARPVLMVNAPSFMPIHFMARKREWFGEVRPELDVLYAGSSELQLTRTGDQSLELATARGYFFGRFERLERDPGRRPLQAGQTIQLDRMRVQVLDVQDGAPTRVGFQLAQPLSGARVYAWQGRKLELLTLPRQGESVRIEPASTL